MEAPKPRARDASIAEASKIPIPRARLRRSRILAFALVVALTVPIVLSVAIVTDTIRLGPTRYDLPANAMDVTVDVRWQNRSVNSSLWDFYSILVTVRNNVFNSTILPYGLDVIIPLSNVSFWGWWPDNSIYRDHQWFATSDDGSSPLMPAGQDLVLPNPSSPGHGAGWMRWSVQGDTSAGNVQVMDDHAQFYIENAALPKGSAFQTNATVTLTWDYRGSIQTYPVASRTIAVDFVMRSA